MALSPQGIRDTTFKTARKGYDTAEVNAFVSEAAEALETAQNEATAMEARARAAVARLQELSQQSGDAAPAAATAATPAAAPAAEVKANVDESETISRTLLLAQRTADTTVAEAQAEADRLLGVARDEAAKLIEDGKAEARRAGESERVRVEGEVQALLARRDFLESDVDHLEQYLVAQRERIVEAVAGLNDIVHRVPDGLADMRRPLVSAAAETVPAAAVPETPSTDVPADAGTSGDDEHDEIAEITRVAEAAGGAAADTSGSLFDDGGDPTQQIQAVNPRETGNS